MYATVVAFRKLKGEEDSQQSTKELMAHFFKFDSIGEVLNVVLDSLYKNGFISKPLDAEEEWCEIPVSEINIDKQPNKDGTYFKTCVQRRYQYGEDNTLKEVKTQTPPDLEFCDLRECPWWQSNREAILDDLIARIQEKKDGIKYEFVTRDTPKIVKKIEEKKVTEKS